MVAREIFGRRARLPIVLIGVLMAFGMLQGNAEAVVLWSEDFDSLAPGTVLTNANMPGWDVKTGMRLTTTSESAASSPNAINSWPSERGVMFRDATGVNELRFSFYRREKTNLSYPNSEAQIGFTSNEDLNPGNSLYGPGVTFLMDSHDNVGRLGFFTRDNASSGIVNRWDLLGVLDDSTWYDGLIRFEADDTFTFGYRALGDTDFTLSGGHAPPPGLTPNYVGVTSFQHAGTNGRTFLDNIVADDGVNVIPEPSSVVSWITLSLCGLFFTWRRRKRVA